MIRTVFDSTTSELLRLIGSQGADSLLENEGLLSYIEMHVTQAQVEEVQQRLKSVLEYLQSLDDDKADAEGLRKFRLTLAHYPLDRFD